MKLRQLFGALCCVCLPVLIFALPAAADSVIATADSPDHVLNVTVTLTAKGEVDYRIDRLGQTVISPSRLGLLLANAPKLDGHFSLASATTSSHDDSWEQPMGEWRTIRNRYTELRVDLVQQVFADRHMAVVFRLYDDGVGFRYELPDQPQLKLVKIIDEQTEFAVADRATAWWEPAGEWDSLEYQYEKTPLAELSQAETPVTIETGKGLFIALHEAALVDYASMWLRRVDCQRLKAHLAPGSLGPSVVRAAPFSTPWRTMIFADSAAGLYMSHLELNLNEPNKQGDVSWVKPFKYIGVWWEMHLTHWTWGAGATHGATTANTEKYIDFAAKNGIPGVLVEGWNQGWDGEWSGNGEDFSFVKAYPDFDLKAVSDYAAAKGIRLIGHHETGGNIAHYESQMDEAMKLYAHYGIGSVKTGYVTDGGTARFAGADGVHYGFTSSQEGVNHYLRSVLAGAKYHIAVDSHEPIKDTGLRRTYPSWITREGGRGEEYNAWGDPTNPPNHVENLVFTRMLAGPFDYTPGILSLAGDKRPLLGTMAKELALYILIYSPIQMVADTPEHYQDPKASGAFQFIKDVPTDWQDTRVLNGEVGNFATIVRKDRNSDDWYLGSSTNEDGRVLSVPLGFLDPGRSYLAEIYRDGEHADYRTDHRFDIVIERRPVTSAETLTLTLAPGGGQAIRFVAQ